MAKIVVMGAGIGGISQVYELRKALGKEHNLVLLGDSDHFEFTPSNPWAGVGWRKKKDITIDLELDVPLFAQLVEQVEQAGELRALLLQILRIDQARVAADLPQPGEGGEDVQVRAFDTDLLNLLLHALA